MLDQLDTAVQHPTAASSLWEMLIVAVGSIVALVVSMVKWLMSRQSRSDRQRDEMYNKMLAEREQVAERREQAISKMLDQFARFEESERAAHAAIVEQLRQTATELAKSSAAQAEMLRMVLQQHDAIRDLSTEVRMSKRG